jgi:hypothetical protein
VTRTSGAGRSRLLRRLARLRTLEWVNVVWLAIVLLWVLPAQRGLAIPAETWLRTLAYLPVAVLLVVGGWYWHRKLQQLRDGRPMGDALRRLDRLDRWLRRMLVVASIGWVVGLGLGASTVTDRWWAAALLAFAWAEYVNYFRLQLMHDTRSDLRRLWETRRLRRSWLASDLAQWRHAAVDRRGRRAPPAGHGPPCTGTP